MNIDICKKCNRYWHFIYLENEKIADEKNNAGFICRENYDYYDSFLHCCKSLSVDKNIINDLKQLNKYKEVNKKKNKSVSMIFLFSHIVFKTKNVDDNINNEINKWQLNDQQCPYCIEHQISEWNKENEF